MPVTKKSPSKKAVAAAGLAALLAIPAEGLREKAYRDPVGIPTICFGSTLGVKMGDVATEKSCRERLTVDMLTAVTRVERFAPAAPVKVTAAFGDAVYNLGPGNILGPRSTAAKYLKAGRWADACNELPKWNKARILGIAVPLPGLTTRRAQERDLCLSP